jgi:hypothetical protein
MTRKQLVETIRKLLKTEDDLQFLLKLEQKEIETFVATIRDRMDQAGK